MRLSIRSGHSFLGRMHPNRPKPIGHSPTATRQPYPFALQSAELSPAFSFQTRDDFRKGRRGASRLVITQHPPKDRRTVRSSRRVSVWHRSPSPRFYFWSRLS